MDFLLQELSSSLNIIKAIEHLNERASHIEAILLTGNYEKVVNFLSSRIMPCVDALKYADPAVLTAHGLGKPHSSSDNSFTTSSSISFSNLYSIIPSLLIKVCNNESHKRDLVQRVCDIGVKLLELYGKPLFNDLIQLSIKSLMKFKCEADLCCEVKTVSIRNETNDQAGEVHVQRETELCEEHALELLSKLADVCKEYPEINIDKQYKIINWKTLALSVIEILNIVDERFITQILLELIPKLSCHFPEEDVVAAVWNCAQKQSNDSDGDIRSLIILGSIADLLFSVFSLTKSADSTASKPIWMNEWYWLTIQRGLLNENDLHRKRSLYFVKRGLNWLENNENSYESPISSNFVWNAQTSKQTSKIFEDFLLVMETIEEKQIHVLKPLFPVILKLIESSIVNEDGNYLLHSSWIVVMLHGLLRHDTKTIRKWTLENICELDLRKFPIFQQQTYEILFSSLLEALNDTSMFSLYAFNPESFIGNKLTYLWNSCAETTRGSNIGGKCFKIILKILKNKSWGAVPVFHLFRSLSRISRYPQWGSAEIEHLKEVLEYTTRAHDIFLRGATQCFIVEAFLKLANPEELTFNDIAEFFGVVKTEECFKRKTKIWKSVTNWLHNILVNEPTSTLNKQFAIFYIKDKMKKSFELQSGDSCCDDSQENFKLVRMIILLFDSGITEFLDDNHEHCFNRLFSIPLNTLQTCFSRPYLYYGLTDLSVQCFLNLILLSEPISMNEEDRDELREWLTEQLTFIIPDFLPFLKIKLTEENNESLKGLDHYFNFLKCLIRLFGESRFMHNFMSDLCHAHLLTFKNNKSLSRKRQFLAGKCFQLFYMLLQTTSSKIIENSVLTKQFAELCLTDDFLTTVAPNSNVLSFAEMTHTINSNQLASLYLSSLWESLACHLTLFPTTEIDDILNQTFSALDIGGSDCIQPVFKCLKHILPKLMINSTDLAVSTIESCWKIIVNMQLNLNYWMSLESFIDMVYQAPMLENKQTSLLLQQYTKELYTMSESSHRIMIHVFKKVTKVWSDATHPLSLVENINLLVFFLTFGCTYKKDLKVQQETVSFITLLNEDCTANELLKSNFRITSEIRSEVIVLLFQFVKKDWSSIIFSQLVIKLMEYELKVTSEKTRHFTNSRIHLTQYKVWQCLLLIEPYLNEETTKLLIDSAFNKFTEDSLQPSVKFLVEWILVRIFYRHPENLPLFWEIVNTGVNKRSRILISTFNIIFNLSTVLQGSVQVEFIETSLKTILPLCMAPHHNTRIHAQFILRRLWDFVQDINLKYLIDKLSLIDNFLSTNRMPNKSRNGEGLKDLFNDFRFKIFHPLEHFTFETLFYEISRIFQVAQEEWIVPKYFEDACKFCKIDMSCIPIINLNNSVSIVDLQKCVPIAEENCQEDEHKDVQRKITPWKAMFPDLEAYKESTPTSRKQSVKGDLVVVASLIDRTPNLGGLCRTCEIFGVAEYVINNLAYVDDKQFQSLCVSADRWVHITEVKISQLKSYLLYMKSAGYLIVGAEQTANSVKLTNFIFPKKTVVVLGNEKDGIPVDIIQLLDVTVEIPQQGIIRSLNVHVTGAIIIWEYTRQQLFDK